MAMKMKGGSDSSVRTLRLLGIAISAIIVTQVLLGAANPWTGFAQWARVSHLTFASLQWVAMCLMTLLILLPVARRSSANASGGRRGYEDIGFWGGRLMAATVENRQRMRTVSKTLLDYVALTKPRVMSLLLFTAVGGSFLAARGVPLGSTSWWC